MPAPATLASPRLASAGRGAAAPSRRKVRVFTVEYVEAEGDPMDVRAYARDAVAILRRRTEAAAEVSYAA